MNTTRSLTRTKQWLHELGPARRREHADELRALARELAEGFEEDAERLLALAAELMPGMPVKEGVEMEAAVAEELDGYELVAWLLERDERRVPWLASKLKVSASHAHRMVVGERPINEVRARQLAALWPELRWERFVTPAAVGERRRAG